MGQELKLCGSDGLFHHEVTCSAGCSNNACDDIRCPGVEFALPNTGWPRFRHDNRNSGWNPVIVADQPTLRWRAGPFGTRANDFSGTLQANDPHEGMSSGPVVSQNDVILVGAGDGDGYDGQLYALDKTGKTTWSFYGNRYYGWSTPAVRTDGTSYFSSPDGNYAVDPSGMQSWKFSTGSAGDCSPIVTAEGSVIYCSDTYELLALNFSGVPQWKSDPSSGPGWVAGALAESCDGVVLAGGDNGWVGMQAQSGAVLWRVAANANGLIANGVMSTPLVAVDGTMYGVDLQGLAMAIDNQGKVLWRQSVGPSGGGTSMAKVGSKLYVVANDGQLHQLDAATGLLGWARPVGQLHEWRRHGGPVVDGRERLYFSSNDGNLYCYDTQGTLLFWVPTSGIMDAGDGFGEIAIGQDGTLYVPANDGYLYAFR
jgi:outer membrane protein assembly factor BamB